MSGVSYGDPTAAGFSRRNAIRNCRNRPVHCKPTTYVMLVRIRGGPVCVGVGYFHSDLHSRQARSITVVCVAKRSDSCTLRHTTWANNRRNLPVFEQSGIARRTRGQAGQQVGTRAAVCAASVAPGARNDGVPRLPSHHKEVQHRYASHGFARGWRRTGLNRTIDDALTCAAPSDKALRPQRMQSI